MQRDMELVRKILFKVEEDIDNVVVYNFEIEGYTMEQVAYHCALLYEGGYISSYKGSYGSDELYSFSVGRLTWDGHEMLDKIREETVWNKTKEMIASSGLPFVFDVVKSVSTGILSGLIKTAITSGI